MRCLVMMVGMTVLLGCASQGNSVRCNTHLQPINVPAIATAQKSVTPVITSATNSTVTPKED